MPDHASLQMVLAAEPQIRATAAKLAELDAVKDCVNSQAIEELPAKKPKLLELSGVSVKQAAEFRGLSERAWALVLTYNELVASLSKKFVQWDEMLAAAEKKVAAAGGGAA